MPTLVFHDLAPTLGAEFPVVSLSRARAISMFATVPWPRPSFQSLVTTCVRRWLPIHRTSDWVGRTNGSQGRRWGHRLSDARFECQTMHLSIAQRLPACRAAS